MGLSTFMHESRAFCLGAQLLTRPSRYWVPLWCATFVHMIKGSVKRDVNSTYCSDMGSKSGGDDVENNFKCVLCIYIYRWWRFTCNLTVRWNKNPLQRFGKYIFVRLFTNNYSKHFKEERFNCKLMFGFDKKRKREGVPSAYNAQCGGEQNDVAARTVIR